MSKIVFDLNEMTNKQKKLLETNQQSIETIKKDCEKLGYDRKELEELEREFL